MVETKDLKVWFPIKRGVMRKTVGHIKAVDGVSIEVRKGETLGVVGESGSGKTTLGLAILRLDLLRRPDRVHGQPAAGPALQGDAAAPPQHADRVPGPFGSLSPRMSIADIVEEGLGVHHPKMSDSEREQRVIRALNDVGLDPETRFRYPHEFSGGQRQRIAVARAIVLEPTFVVLDEPTSALDMLIQAQIVDLLRDIQKRRDLTYLFISHDLKVVAALASRLVVMKDGKVVEAGAGVRAVQESAERLHPRAVRRRLQARNRGRRRGGAVARRSVPHGPERHPRRRSTARRPTEWIPLLRERVQGTRASRLAATRSATLPTSLTPSSGVRRRACWRACPI